MKYVHRYDFTRNLIVARGSQRIISLIYFLLAFPRLVLRSENILATTEALL